MASKLEEAAIEGLQAVANLGVDHRSPEFENLASGE